MLSRGKRSVEATDRAGSGEIDGFTAAHEAAVPVRTCGLPACLRGQHAAEQGPLGRVSVTTGGDGESSSAFEGAFSF